MEKKITEILAEVKGWGFTGLGAGIAGLVVWLVFGMPVIGGILLGIFATINWDILALIIEEKTGVEV